jgi:hypothetical protein
MSEVLLVQEGPIANRRFRSPGLDVADVAFNEMISAKFILM